MGTLFPDDPEYPDHKPLSPKVDPIKATVPVALTVVLYGACPKTEERHDHVPHHEVAMIWSSSPTIASTGSAGAGSDPMTWQNSSVFDAADMIIRRGNAQRDAHTRMAGSTGTMGSTGLLLSL